MPVREFARTVPWVGLLVTATMGLANLLLGDHLSVSSWGGFIAKGFALAVPATVVGASFDLRHVRRLRADSGSSA